MKKIITAVSVFVLISCLAVFLYGCGAEDENVTTTTPATTEATTRDTTNEGMVTDTSEKDDDGALGEAVTDVSEGISEVVTDISEDVSRK